MCYYSLTISSDSPKLALKYPLFLDVFHLPSVINLHSLPILVLFKRELQPLKRVQLHLSRLFTYLLMIWLILLQLLHLLTWTPQLCLIEVLPSLVFILPSILSTQPPECLIPLLLVMSITMLQEVFKNFFKTTSPFKILLLFWVLMIYLKKINSLSQEQERFKNSFLNPSLCLKFSQVIQEDSLISRIALLHSKVNIILS